MFIWEGVFVKGERGELYSNRYFLFFRSFRVFGFFRDGYVLLFFFSGLLGLKERGLF